MITLLLAAQAAIGAHAVPSVTRASPVPGGSRTDVQIIQSALHGTARRGALSLQGTLSLEGLTMRDGQVTPGAWGEGYIDSRHPHTWVHELVVSLGDPISLPVVRWSLSAGKGFAAYGSDDPMGRPPMLFPANHHWSQVLERAMVTGAVRAGPVTLEGSLFNGDEPEDPGQWPDFSRFGDSWSLRGMLAVRGVELQLSRARVKSPEHRQGAGLEHLMWHGSARLDRDARAGRVYALVELARVDEEGAFEFGTALAEAQLVAGAHRPYLRFERTERPEETRALEDPFRGVRPHNENSNLGTTRWTTYTAGYGRRLPWRLGPARFEAIGEIMYAHVTRVTGIVFDPEPFYGGNDLWTLSVGLRIGAGAPMPRMGRYGAAAGHTNGHIH